MWHFRILTSYTMTIDPDSPIKVSSGNEKPNQCKPRKQKILPFLYTSTVKNKHQTKLMNCTSGNMFVDSTCIIPFIGLYTLFWICPTILFLADCSCLHVRRVLQFMCDCQRDVARTSKIHLHFIPQQTFHILYAALVRDACIAFGLWLGLREGRPNF